MLILSLVSEIDIITLKLLTIRDLNIHWWKVKKEHAEEIRQHVVEVC